MATDLEDPSNPARPGEACGVFGIYSSEPDAARVTYFGLFALQHRGQESAGIAVSDGETITVYKDLGLVAQVFDEATLAGLTGNLAIGHTRYSTTGSSVWANSQPVYRQTPDNGVALGHNGNLTNTSRLSALVPDATATTDTELMTALIAARMVDNGDDLETALTAVLPTFEGAYTLVLMDRTQLVGVRDPHGFRPLCLGRIEGGWVLASETAALDLVGATLERELEAGEVVIVDEDGVRSLFPFAESDPRLCLFEFVYFARPDSTLRGQNVHRTRRRMGMALAEQSPVDADAVVPVPESGIPAAQGFA